MESTEDVDAESLETFRDAAQVLRQFAKNSSPTEARSIQHATDEVELLLSAMKTLGGWTGQGMDVVLQTLAVTAGDLERLADGERLGLRREQEISEFLSQIRRVAALMRARVPESAQKAI